MKFDEEMEYQAQAVSPSDESLDHIDGKDGYVRVQLTEYSAPTLEE